MHAAIKTIALRRTFREVSVGSGARYVTYINGLRDNAAFSRLSQLLWLLMESPGTVVRYEVLWEELGFDINNEKRRIKNLRQTVSRAQAFLVSAGVDVRIACLNDVGYVLCVLPASENQNAPPAT